ncbi:zona pellucida sperm-binding protein 3-like [Rhinoderma darwinii]|uniref:zona pellucida sperm-binding protein 3-like n=1 Tax=Rhinoderma darwinii TaxID=43563 RepID=UPI003F66C357
MELWVRWSWLLVVLLYGRGFSSSLVRHQRQSDPRWRNYQPGWGSSRGLGQPVSGVGSPRGNPWSPVQTGWGSRYIGEFQPRQLTQSPNSPISVQCGEDRLVVMVTRDFYGNGKLVKASDLTLGSQPCRARPQSSDTTVIFENGLQECGSNLEMTPDWLVYTINLRYNPTSSSNVPITRFNSALVPIQCYYPRHGNVSSKAVKPTWVPFSTTVTTEERLVFSLQLMNEDWSAPRSSLVFQLGDMFYIEASLDVQNHVPMTLFVDSCVATLTADVTSNPRYEIIAYNGCLMDGMQEDSSSAFLQRPQASKLRFKVDAFRFTDRDLSTIYITCTLRAADINQTPDPVNKACSYNKATSSWSPVEGSSGICQCCTTRNCATASGQRMTWGSSLGRPRGLGKRDVGSPVETHVLATLGPLLVTGDKPNQSSGAAHTEASRMTAGRDRLQLWVMVAIGSVSSVVAVIALTMVGRCLLNRFFNSQEIKL